MLRPHLSMPNLPTPCCSLDIPLNDQGLVPFHRTAYELVVRCTEAEIPGARHCMAGQGETHLVETAAAMHIAYCKQWSTRSLAIRSENRPAAITASACTAPFVQRVS